MSKATNPTKEGSVSCGFYNSLGDRKYDAIQMSRLFDGIINDGIFASIGTCLVVKADEGISVNVGVGKAWFNHTWTENDAILPIACEESEVLLDRIDAIVLEVNSEESVRDNFIKAIKGTPSSEPVRPTMIDDSSLHQHALCYIYRKAGSTEIRDADITNMVGTDETPFITGILQTISLDTLLSQWRDELDRFIEDEEADFAAWYADMKKYLDEVLAEIDTFKEAEKNSILEWFQHMKDQLSTDAAANLQIQLDEETVRRILMIGFVDGTKTFSEDGLTISATDADGRELTKVFSSDFLTCTTTLKDISGSVIGEMVKTFSADGKTISSTVNIR